MNFVLQEAGPTAMLLEQLQIWRSAILAQLGLHPVIDEIDSLENTCFRIQAIRHKAVQKSNALEVKFEELLSLLKELKGFLRYCPTSIDQRIWIRRRHWNYIRRLRRKCSRRVKRRRRSLANRQRSHSIKHFHLQWFKRWTAKSIK